MVSYNLSVIRSVKNFWETLHIFEMSFMFQCAKEEGKNPKKKPKNKKQSNNHNSKTKTKTKMKTKTIKLPKPNFLRIPLLTSNTGPRKSGTGESVMHAASVLREGKGGKMARLWGYLGKTLFLTLYLPSPPFLPFSPTYIICYH